MGAGASSPSKGHSTDAAEQPLKQPRRSSSDLGQLLVSPPDEVEGAAADAALPSSSSQSNGDGTSSLPAGPESLGNSLTAPSPRGSMLQLASGRSSVLSSPRRSTSEVAEPRRRNMLDAMFGTGDLNSSFESAGAGTPRSRAGSKEGTGRASSKVSVSPAEAEELSELRKIGRAQNKRGGSKSSTDSEVRRARSLKKINGDIFDG
eukprot:TRINITY_DN85149_c0_g1_i1.p1 TRINITY_DN85149_c0_g1~~TRINITY_DN85149_c0_g1_i1.p1  ORF type:complete len:205 (-),score=33.33 TRINITY_DN85149_c0_g1_i1:62-676(-)